MKSLYTLGKSEKTVLTCDKYDGQIFVGVVELPEDPRSESLGPFAAVGVACLAGFLIVFVVGYLLQ